MSRAQADRRVVVNLHGIGDPPPGVPRDEMRFWCPRNEWPDIADALAEASSEGRGVEITFDDGNTSDVEEGLPALVQRGLTATFHVCAGRIGQLGYLDGQALLHLREAGMSVGSHGWDHVDLRTLSDTELVRATRGSREHIAEACGAPVTRFAVPLGSYDRRVLQHLRDYQTVYTSDTTSARAPSRLVPRWSYVQGWTAEFITELVRGGESLRHRWRQQAAMVAKRWR